MSSPAMRSSHRHPVDGREQAAGDAAPRIRVAICTNRPPHQVRSTLEGLCVQGADPGLIYVTSGLSPDEAAAHDAQVRALVPNATTCHEPRAGLSIARNRALAACDDDTVIAFIDDDAVPSPTWLRELRSIWDAAPAAVGCIGGPIRPQFLGVRPGWLSDDLLRSLSILDYGESPLELQDGRRALFGANMSFRCAMLRAVDGFDERLGAGTPMGVGEDDEAQRALVGRGWRVRYEPAPWVWHRVPTSRLRPREIAERRFRYGAFLGVRRMRPRRLAVRRCLASGLRIPGAIARRDSVLAVEWGANLAENVGVLVGARVRRDEG